MGGKILEEKSRNQCGLDIFGDAFDRVIWENIPEGMYSNCKMKLFNKRSLEQARQRKEKERPQREEEKKTKMMGKIENDRQLESASFFLFGV